MQTHSHHVEIVVAGEDLHPEVAELVVDRVELVDDGPHHLLVFLEIEGEISTSLGEQ